MKAVIDSIVNKAARRYARRVWWADRNELVQEGWLAAIQAQRTWSPTGKAGFRWYVWRSVVVALRNFLLRESAPVKIGASRHLHKLKGLTRVEIASRNGKVGLRRGDRASMDVIEWAHPGPTPESQLAAAFRQSGTRREVLHGIHGGHHAAEVVEVLVGGRRLLDVAQEAGIAWRPLQRACTAARHRIRGSRTAQDLLESE